VPAAITPVDAMLRGGRGETITGSVITVDGGRLAGGA